MELELKALEDNATWEVTELPPHKKAIACKWVYRVKYKANGEIERYKARLVAKGFNQIHGIDYFESFSPVAKTVTVRLLFAIGAAKKWQIHQVVVNNAYLQRHIDEEIFMLPPQGYNGAKSGQVCKLVKSLYGLKQAGRQWHKEITSKLLNFSFNRSKNDYCLFIKRLNEDNYIALLIYVDDILIMGPSQEHIQGVKDFLHTLFTIKDMGTAKYFVGVEVAQLKNGTFFYHKQNTFMIY